MLIYLIENGRLIQVHKEYVLLSSDEELKEVGEKDDFKIFKKINPKKEEFKRKKKKRGNTSPKKLKTIQVKTGIAKGDLNRKLKQTKGFREKQYPVNFILKKDRRETFQDENIVELILFIKEFLNIEMDLNEPQDNTLLFKLR